MTESLYYIAVVASFVFFSLTVFIIYISVFHNKKKSVFRQELAKAQLEIKEQTLRDIAYELHDNLGQVASLIKINLNTLQLSDYEKSTQKIEDTKELVRQLILDLKSLSISLNSDRVVQLGFFKIVEQEVERLNKLGQLRVELTQEGPAPIINSNTTVILYRMVQELLNNILKHSAASQVTISLVASKNYFTLVIFDNGTGFDLTEKLKSGGSGLLNLQGRAKLIGADLSIKSTPGEGTQVRIELPFNSDATFESY